jgi:hypothetical protein
VIAQCNSTILAQGLREGARTISAIGEVLRKGRLELQRILGGGDQQDVRYS